MHFLAEIERTKTVAVDTFFSDHAKYLIMISLGKSSSAISLLKQNIQLLLEITQKQ
tara:strand:- start:191 stop:358 length:168 start_codon:yes stop_codon:yes gene_type:complete